jgi:hypothetical protein
MATRASGTAASVEHEVEASRGCAGVEASAQARRGVSAVVLGTKGRSRCGFDATRREAMSARAMREEAKWNLVGKFQQHGTRGFLKSSSDGQQWRAWVKKLSSEDGAGKRKGRGAGLL